MLVKRIMQVLRNLFGLNKKISWEEIACKNSSDKSVTLDEYLKVNYEDDKEVATNDFLNGKRIYAKRIVTTQKITGSTSGTTLSIPHGISNYDEIWVDLSNSYMINANKRSVPIVSTYYVNTTQNEFLSVTVDGSDVLIMSGGGWGTDWKKVVLVKYTKK